MIRDDLMIEVENAVKAEMQAYQDPSRIDDLRAYHIPDHGTQVANEVLATDCIVRKTPINFQKALALAALAHDVVPPDFSTHIDINRPWPFTYRRFQIFDGQSEEASLNWFVRSFGRHFDDQTIELIGDCIIATTTERDSYGVVTQPKILEAKDQKAAFVIAKADILGHQFNAIPRIQEYINLRIWLELYPDFLAKLYDPKYVINNEAFNFAVEEIKKIPAIALDFYNQQLELFFEDGKKVFGMADLKALEARMFLASTSPLNTFKNPDWPWLKSKNDLMSMLRKAIGIKINK